MLVRSLKKSVFLARVAKHHDQQFEDPMRMLLNPWPAEEQIKELWQHCHGFKGWRRVAESHGCDLETLHEIYQALLCDGAAQVVRGHYVPMSALAFPGTLEYLLNELELPRPSMRQISDATTALLDYFGKGRLGKVA